MDEPVSLWDTGVFRAEQHFKGRFGESSTIEMRVAHSSNTNKLVILARENGQVGEDPETHCRSIISHIREELSVSSATGKPVVGATSRLSYFFSHVDHLRSARPSDLSEELDAMTVIKAFIPNASIVGSNSSARKSHVGPAGGTPE